jgi:hypothetical protein
MRRVRSRPALPGKTVPAVGYVRGSVEDVRPGNAGQGLELGPLSQVAGGEYLPADSVSR